MGGRRQYYTLIASLPYLPRFDRAERLPITRERLRERRRMLEPDDAELVERAVRFLAWHRQAVDRTDAEMVADYRRMAALMEEEPALMNMFEFRVDQRTIMAALRRRQRGLPAPTPGKPWGVGRWVRHIERNWDAPNFKLSAVHPWIPQAREYLEAGESLALERLLFSRAWDRWDRMAQGDTFGFEALVAYLFKWDILIRWLSYDRDGAKTRFEELLLEVTGEQDRLFG
jgi:hypothetical protein